MARSDLPVMYDFPDRLTFLAQDGQGNAREVNYIRADKFIHISGRIEDIFELDLKQRDWKKGEE